MMHEAVCSCEDLVGDLSRVLYIQMKKWSEKVKWKDKAFLRFAAKVLSTTLVEVSSGRLKID